MLELKSCWKMQSSNVSSLCKPVWNSCKSSTEYTAYISKSNALLSIWTDPGMNCVNQPIAWFPVPTWQYSDCQTYAVQYSVRPYLSWGVLPKNLRGAWVSNKCNSLLTANANLADHQNQTVSSQTSSLNPIPKSSMLATNTAKFTPDISKFTKSQCDPVRNAKPKKQASKLLPKTIVSQWNKLKCASVVNWKKYTGPSNYSCYVWKEVYGSITKRVSNLISPTQSTKCGRN